MPILRACTTCGRQNRIYADHLADTGRCGACKAPLNPAAEPVEADPDLFDEIKRSLPSFLDSSLHLASWVWIAL